MIDKQVPALHNDDEEMQDQAPVLISDSDDHDQGREATTSKANCTKKYTQSNQNDAPGLVDFCKFISGSPIPPQQTIRVRFSTDNSQKGSSRRDMFCLACTSNKSHIF